jgi:hypothetical protein
MFTNKKKLARRLATPQVGTHNKALEMEQVKTNFLMLTATMRMGIYASDSDIR